MRDEDLREPGTETGTGGQGTRVTTVAVLSASATIVLRLRDVVL